MYSIKNVFLFAPSLLLLLLFIFVSCNKTSQPEPETRYARYQAEGMRLLNDLLIRADEAGFLGSISTGCSTITYDTASNPDTLFIDYGTTNCLCNDGLMRRGLIKIAFTGDYTDSLTNHNIISSNFAVNDFVLSGNLISYFNDYSHTGKISFDITFAGQFTTSPDVNIINWNVSMSREWTEGISTADFSDNIYQYNGNCTGLIANGVSWKSNTIIPLSFADSCHTRYPVTGVEEISVDGLDIMVMDYSYSNCNYFFVLTVNGDTTQVAL